MKKGFTLIELIVSIAIMVLILAVILVNYRKFDSGIVMTNLAYDIALSIRTAQTYGISAKGTVVSGTNQTFTTPYGISFDTSVSRKSYKLFADTNTHGFYDPADIAPTTYNLQGSYKISDLCTLDTSANETCDSITNNIKQIDITFVRPNPDALMCVNKCTVDTSSISAVEIKISSTQDSKTEKIITIRPTGQISVCSLLNSVVSCQ